MPLSRRRILGFGAALLSPGCSSFGRSQSDDCTSGFDVSGERFDPVADLASALDGSDRAIVTEAVETGSAERTTYGQEPLRGGLFVEHDGSFYETAVSTAETEVVTAYRLNLEWENGRDAPDEATVVEFSGLPDIDQEVLRSAVYGSDERREHPAESMSVNDFPAPYPDGGDASELVSGVTWVRWNDRTYRVEIGESTTQERRTFRYTVKRVAMGSEEFRTVAASRYRIDLTDIPDDEREIVSKALGSGYEECSPASDALKNLQDRLPDDQRLPHPGDGWYVGFDGEEYEFTIMQWET